MVASLDGLKKSYGNDVSGFLELQEQFGADQKEAVDLMNQLKGAQEVKK